MEPFNIRILYKGKEVTLTILPENNMIFTIVYFGGVLGAIQKNGAEWKLLNGEINSESGLPGYRTCHNNSRTEIEFNNHVAEDIGIKIDQVVSGALFDPRKPIPAHRRRIKD
jgi:hypothetical protein